MPWAQFPPGWQAVYAAVLLDAYRAAKTANGNDPVKAWAAVVNDPETRSNYQRARGKGGLVRSSWPEVLEIIGAAHVQAPGSDFKPVELLRRARVILLGLLLTGQLG